MTDDERRQIENYAIACPLSQIHDRDMLAFVASLIQDHNHLREKLMTENNRQARRDKFEAMRPHLSFVPLSVDKYELAELARCSGVQPIYDEQEKMEQGRLWLPPSFIHEVN